MVGIVGCGRVGGAMKALFPDAIQYDKLLNIGNQESINKCEIVFVCVPTPCGLDGQCDTSCVDEVLEWVNTDTIVIRSTVPIGYTKRKRNELNKNIIFQPEYYGETVNHPLSDLSKRDWIVLGGDSNSTKDVVKTYQSVYTADIRIIKVDSDIAEMAKYMGNAFLAVKVIFCNEFYDIANAFGVDYDILREVWLMDPRIGRTHTFVYENDRGYGGSCFPKDMLAIKNMAKGHNIMCDLITAAIEKNTHYKSLP